MIGNLAGGLTLARFFDSPDPAMVAWGRTIIGLHKSLGLTVIALTLVRIAWRLGHARPPLPGHMTSLERMLARATHLLFYVLLLALPISGWAMMSTGRTVRPTRVFGLVSIPPLPVTQQLGAMFGDGHELLGWAMLATIVLHISAAVKHQFFDRDELLARMLP
ncbi:cytochrome b561 [Polymorphobacter fuscus]|nr:cytochrome b561 [Polymorphobacter fuscus]